MLSGGSLRESLRELMRRGMDGRRGLDDLAERVRRLREAARRRGDLGGTLDQVRAMLDQALAEERDSLAGEDGDDARLAEMDLATIPDDVAGAVRALGDYEWHSPEAKATYEQIAQMLQREVVGAQFEGLKQALSGNDPEAMQAVKDMLADLNQPPRRPRPRRGHRGPVPRLHGQARRALPRAARERRRAHRRISPAPGRRRPADGLAHAGAARAARPAHGRRPR